MLTFHGTRCTCCAPSGRYFATDATSRADPTGTTGIRRSYEAALVKRFKRVRALIYEAIVKNDVLGQGVQAQTFLRAFGRDARGIVTDQVAPPKQAFAFATSGQKVTAFMAWLNEMVAQEILGISYGTAVANAADNAWQNVYIQSAYSKGIKDAGENLKKAGATVNESWITAAFNRPIHADRIGLAFTRAFSDLAGITEVMDAQISRVIAQGLAEGRGPMWTARQMASRVDKIGITRARVLARTETIRAHAQATLASYREAEVEGVNLAAEWVTAGDDRVCLECESLEGREYSLNEAEGVIPVHPNCRCAMVPVVKDPEGITLS